MQREENKQSKQINSRYWDDILYPIFRSAIRGEFYGTVPRNFIDEECYYLTIKAISAFKFPKVSLAYDVFYGYYDDEGTWYECESLDDDMAIPHALFKENIDNDTLEVLVAWMKVYWCERMISNSDNFEEMYTDSNIKTFSRANAIDKYLKMMEQFRSYAKDLENRYSRVNKDRRPALGDVNKYE